MSIHEEGDPGDTKHILQQVLALQDDIKKWCYRFLKNQEEAEDAARDVVLKALKAEFLQSPSRYSGKASIKTWLYHIACNHCNNLINREKRPISTDEDKFPELGDDRESPVEVTVVNRVFCQQLLDAVERKAVSRKPPWDTDDYLIFELRYDDEKRTWPEIAKILDKPVDTVKWHFYNHVLPTLKEVEQEFKQC